MERNANQTKAPISKRESNLDGNHDLKSLPMPDVEKELGSSADGLSQAEVQKRLTQYGPNEIEDKKTNPFLKFLTYFWGPIPWIIEAAVLLSAVARHWPDFVIILLLLLANAVVGFWEEHQAGNAIAALKAKLAIKATVKRDGKWINPAARDLVPGDVIQLHLGDIVPADARLLEGDPVEVDQSALTGESLPATRKSSDAVFSGSIIRQGEIGALVYATGANTYFGKTAQLVQEAHTVSHFQRAVLKIGNYLIILAVLLVAVIIAVAIFRGDPVLTTLQFALVLTVAAIPVAMPTVLSVTMAVGARLLAKKEAIVTRLSAIEELAGVDILCSDKTGTLTQNKLTLGDPFSVNDMPADQVILNAALASRADNKDTIDLAVLGGLKNDQALKGYEVIHFQPFDPVHKRTEATVKDVDGKEFKVAKGAPQVILKLSANAAQVKSAAEKAVNDFAARGFRSLGVARAEGDGKWQFLGVLPLFDPPRGDAKATIATARQMGVFVKMVTGDALAIARETAKKLGMGANILDASGFGDTNRHETAALAESIEKADGFAQVFPEHKFHIVDVLQQGGHIVGMTGDGVNDAPALKKADCGIAVSGATDAARAAAAIVLMTPGLSVIIDAIKESRKIFQRMNSYAIYRIAETLRVLLFMTLSILIFNFYPLTAVMIVMLALLNDGAILSIAYDNVHYKNQPEAWNMRLVLGIATVLGVVGVVSAFGLFYLGERVFRLDRAHIQTLMYLKLSVAGHLTIFLTRTRGPFWSIRPARVLWVAVLGTQVLATLIAVYGLFMTPLGWGWSLFVWGYAVAWFLVNDRVKLLAYQILDPVKAGSVRTRAGRAWIEARHPRVAAGSPELGQIQPGAMADQAAVGWVSAHWRIPAAAVALVALTFGGGGGWFYWATHRTATVHYATQKIELGSIIRSVTASGVVVPIATVPVSARVSGVIQALHCAANTKVKTGQICAKIDPRPYETVVNQANADLAAAEDRLEKEKRDLAYAKAAFEHHEARSKRRAISLKALDKSRRAYEQAQTQTKLDDSMVAELEAALHAGEINLGYTNIVSPIDGPVVSRNAVIGETVLAGSETAPLFLIAADLTVIRVDANVSKNDIDEIKLGDKASFTVESVPKRPFIGEVTKIGPSPQTIQNILASDVVITASNPELLLEPGMTATIKIVLDRHDAVLRAPDQALRYSPAGRAAPNGNSGARTPLNDWQQVWILREGRPTAVPVQLGLQDGAFTEIVKGDLKPGDDLIVSESGSRVTQ
ncbi:plasma-membrane proton-efflux P-type ATPase [Methylocapsa sp. D3K7]|uniref:plasma-membrane proton-efflux P-type ATPase n=1 Tax=Methylocapsa sp. D3K7 TaxID=3041435 RepID=UPI00244EB5F1|nr:plasma-membrane proton-efflux P-type ATPase [Methylocapsa sp. D3K7]WGJ13241.1 plasma-membrane proton-efflux P-type ATPase [Methylocapsa sp. D3K7]